MHGRPEDEEMLPLDEGGFYRILYTSPMRISLPHGERPLASSIFYALTEEQPIGMLHRNRSDIIHFLIDGGPIEYLTYSSDGVLSRSRMDESERFLLVPGGEAKASRLVDGATYGRVAEVVVPGFDYADRDFVTEEELWSFPHLVDVLSPFLAPAR
ncbi:putative cupin superfamily sugar epimerase [Catenulispora sp. GP43]|uniref:cupin domain-containing protein n=1 Tax=Catenulispora sp. GP43 TaxID=3156263 RepID=UPI003514B802